MGPEELEEAIAADVITARRCMGGVPRRREMDDPAAILASLSHFVTPGAEGICMP